MGDLAVLHVIFPLDNRCVMCSSGLTFNSEYSQYLQQKIDYNEFLVSMNRINSVSQKAYKTWCVTHGIGWFIILIAWVLIYVYAAVSSANINSSAATSIVYIYDTLFVIGFIILVVLGFRRKRNTVGFKRIQIAVKYESELYRSRNISWNLVDTSPCCCRANFHIDIDLTKCNINIPPYQMPFNFNIQNPQNIYPPPIANPIQNPINLNNMNADPTAPELELPPPYVEEPVMETKETNEKANNNNDEVKFCGHCGEKRSNSEKFCTKCGKQFINS